MREKHYLENKGCSHKWPFYLWSSQPKDIMKTIGLTQDATPDQIQGYFYYPVSTDFSQLRLPRLVAKTGNLATVRKN